MYAGLKRGGWQSMIKPLFASLAVLLAAGCAPLSTQVERCPTRDIATMPRVPANANTLPFWSQKWASQGKKLLLSQRNITALNATNSQRPWAYQDVTSSAIGDQQRVTDELEERRLWIKQRVDSGRYVETKIGSFKRMVATIQSASPVDEVRILAARTDLRCMPSQDKLIAPASTPEFDRNQCSGLAAGSVVRVLRRASPWFYVHGAHSVGWIKQPRWTPPVTASKAQEFRDGAPRMVFTKTTRAHGEALNQSLGDSFPIDIMSDAEGGIPLIMPTVSGLASRQVAPRDGMEQGWLAFTAENVLRLAFSEMNRGYGWGESAGLTDCSRLLFDVFRAFGIRLGRHSSDQAKSGTTTRKVGHLSSPEKLTILGSLAKRGVVLLYMPGHIMLYLGEHKGQHFSLSAIHDFHGQCPGRKAEGKVRIKRVTVSDLQVGVGTTKGSFLERLTRLTLFGTSAGDGE
jgi:cell wall-associated NlpC family hydrolase